MGIYIKGMDVPAIVKIHYGPNGKRYIEDPRSREWREMVTVPDHGRLIDADKLIDRLEKQRTVILHQLPGVHSRTEGYTSEDYIFERNGDMISILRNYAAIIPADREGEA